MIINCRSREKDIIYDPVWYVVKYFSPKTKQGFSWFSNAHTHTYIYLRQYNIMWADSRSWGYVDGLFSIGSEVKGKPPLPLCFIEDSVHNLKGNHVTIHLHCNFLARPMDTIAHKIYEMSSQTRIWSKFHTSKKCTSL